MESLGQRWGQHRVFNLEVDLDHTYYVTRQRVLTHNSYTESQEALLGAYRKLDDKLAGMKEGVYQFAEGAKTYVGQSGNLRRRLRKHIRDGRLTDLDNLYALEVKGGKWMREVAEQSRMNGLTSGIGASSELISNIINPIGGLDRKKAFDRILGR